MILIVQKKIRLAKYLSYYSEWNLAASNYMLTERLKQREFWPVCVTRLNPKLYIFAEL